MRTYVIATSKFVPQQNWDNFVDIVANMTGAVGIRQTTGPGCTNIGLCVPDDKEEQVKQLTFMLMPSRFADASEAPFEGFTNELTD